jgi:hypothetical protein
MRKTAEKVRKKLVENVSQLDLDLATKINSNPYDVHIMDHATTYS